jgi:hypothetical protein
MRIAWPPFQAGLTPANIPEAAGWGKGLRIKDAPLFNGYLIADVR